MIISLNRRLNNNTMQNITSASELKTAIRLSEEEQTESLKRLKEQFFLTYEGLNPSGLLKSTLKGVVSSPFLVNSILGITMGLTSGFLTKNIVIRASGHTLGKIIGSVLQTGILKVAKNLLNPQKQ